MIFAVLSLKFKKDIKLAELHYGAEVWGLLSLSCMHQLIPNKYIVLF